MHDGEVWIKPSFGHGDASRHWRGRLEDGLAHNLGLVIAKGVWGQLTAGVPAPAILRQAALFAVQNRDGWGIGGTILTALGNLPPCCRNSRLILHSTGHSPGVPSPCDPLTFPVTCLSTRFWLAPESGQHRVSSMLRY